MEAVTKICSSCGESKGVEEFYKTGGVCKACGKVYRREYYENNKRQWNKYYENNKRDNKEKILKYQAEYRKNNREKILEHQAEYRKNNREKIKGIWKKYQNNNRDKLKEYGKKRTASVPYSYAKGIVKKCYSLENPPPELIETKRNVIKIKRLLNQIKKKTNDTVNTAKQ